jgi:hypothetical protein
MNSDFVQQHAERLAADVVDAADDEARITAVYRRIFGRAPSARELSAGREFLAGEALKQYEERRAAAAATPPAKGGSASTPDATSVPAPAASDAKVDADPAAAGMMAGVTPGAGTSDDEKKKMRPVTAFGRYVKVLLSSNEFVFVS